jgi:hypothetical protein
MPGHALEMESLQQLEMEFAEPGQEITVKTEEEKSSSGGKWSIVMEEVWFPCFGSYPNLQVHTSEEEARTAFKSLKGPRILIDENGVEVTAASGAPWKNYALRMIRQKLARNHFALPCHQARQRNTEEFCELDSYDFSDNEYFNNEDFCFNNSSMAVELPRKALPSDMVSTVGDLGSSRTTHSEFTIATLESRSSEAVPPILLPQEGRPKSPVAGKSNGIADEKSNDSVDICQSTSSSVYRLLDLDSRSGSVYEE